jgi:hypothetical protein
VTSADTFADNVAAGFQPSPKLFHNRAVLNAALSVNRKIQRDAGLQPWYTSNMADLQTIIRSVHDLSPQDKLLLREVINRDLALTEQNSASKNSELVGLFADDSQLLDEVMDLVYQERGRPWISFPKCFAAEIRQLSQRPMPISPLSVNSPSPSLRWPRWSKV